MESDLYFAIDVFLFTLLYSSTFSVVDMAGIEHSKSVDAFLGSIRIPSRLVLV